MLPGYVYTNIAKAAIGGKGGVAFGKDDPHTLKGMSAEKFAELTVEAIYFKDKEVAITSIFLHHVAIILRVLWPEAIFYYLHAVLKKEMQKFISADKKTD